MLVSAISGFIAGLLASIFATGVRKMLAPLVLPQRICLGKLSLSSADRHFPCWYIPVSVRASGWWHLVVSTMEDVKAIVVFINRDTGGKLEGLATWVEPGWDDPAITLRIGGEYELRIATISGGVLKMFESVDQEDSLIGNYDIVVRLRSGKRILGQWLFEKGVLEGSMREVSPMKIVNRKGSTVR